jgi:hypothetical protein
MTYYSCYDFRVDPEGFEPSAFSMPLRRAPNCAMGPNVARIVLAILYIVNAAGSSVSGPGGIRTLGLFSAIEARSQLRYRPLSARIVPFPILPVKAATRSASSLNITPFTRFRFIINILLQEATPCPIRPTTPPWMYFPTVKIA